MRVCAGSRAAMRVSASVKITRRPSPLVRHCERRRLAPGFSGLRAGPVSYDRTTHSRACVRDRDPRLSSRVTLPSPLVPAGRAGKETAAAQWAREERNLRAQVARCRCVRVVGRSRRSLARENHVRERERDGERRYIAGRSSVEQREADRERKKTG